MNTIHITNEEFFAEKGIQFNMVNIRGMTYNINREIDDALLLNNFSDLEPHYDPEIDSCPVLHLGKGKNLEIPDNVGQHMLIDAPTHKELCNKFVEQKGKIIRHIISQTFAKGFEYPSQVQSIATLELVLGRDALVQSKSGTGKTHTFLSGLLWHFDLKDSSLQHIYITCSHEIAKQIHEQAIELMPSDSKISLFIGNKPESRGVISGDFKTQSKSRPKSTRELIEEARTSQIIVCTLGKFYDLLTKKAFNLDYLKTICVDEFDKIVSHESGRKSASIDNMTTDEQFKRIIDLIPARTQRVFLSATVTPDSVDAALSYFRPDHDIYGTPYIVLLNKDDFTLDGIKQYYVKSELKSDKLAIIGDLLRYLKIKKIIIFVNRKETSLEVKSYLDNCGLGVNTEVMHGDLSSKDRSNIHDTFKIYGAKILIATDVIARGLDIHDVNIVINYDMPESPETYIHRAGRTARYGRRGTVINIIIENKYTDETKKIQVIESFSKGSKMEELPADLGSVGC